MRAREPHDGCRAYEPCEAGAPASCPREHGRALRRNARASQWSELELRRDAGGFRHYLDGRAVHCGEGLVLQVMDERYDDDGNGYTVWLQKGHPVRYEASQTRDGLAWSLYTGVAGVTFSTGGEAWFRFRWPS